MTIEKIRDFCLTIKGVTESVKWENHLCFSVGDKMFIITNPDEFPVSASIKVSDENFAELSGRNGIVPAPYLARYKWVKIDDISLIAEDEWKTLLKESYDLIFEKLPPKIKKSVG